MNRIIQKHLEATEVVLPRVPMTSHRDVDLEPQPVTAMPPASATVTITTEDLQAGIPRNNFVISGNITYLTNVSRIKPVAAEIDNWFIPNVNPRNNTFTFFSSVSASLHTVTLAPGYYDDAAALMADIVIALNTVSGASGIVFSELPLANNPRAFTLTGTGTWYFDSDCSAVAVGDTVYGLPTSQTATLSKKIGPMMLKYTTFVDIVSTTLTKYSKLHSITSNARSSIFARMYPTDQFREIEWGIVYDSFTAEDIKFGFRPNEVVTSIDIQLYDSHGQLLYIPDDLNLRFRLTFATEL